MADQDVLIELNITHTESRKHGGGGTWVRGTINDEYRFAALVFAGHAECESYELGRSKISKLWIQRIADKQVQFNFDRGLDVPAATPHIQVVVDFLCVGWADFVLED